MKQHSNVSLLEQSGDCEMPSDEIQEVFELFATWRHDGLTPLVSIKGYTELLLKGVAGDLTDRQREFIEIIYQSSLRAVKLWHHPTDYLQCRFGSRTREWKPRFLSDVIAEALDYLEMYAQIGKVNIDLPDDLPPIRGTPELSSAFICLIDSDTPYYYWKDQPITIRAVLSKPATVVVHLHTGLKLAPECIKEPMHFFYPGSRASTADLIVRLHGGHITVRATDEGTEFQFALQVWDE
jgi:K+-sensing histidine kinase KdpD